MGTAHQGARTARKQPHHPGRVPRRQASAPRLEASHFSATSDNFVVPLPQTLRSSKGVSSARGAQESLRDGPLDAQLIPISSGRPGSGVPLAEESPDAQHVPTRAQRPHWGNTGGNRFCDHAPLRKSALCERAPSAKERPLRKSALCERALSAKERPLRKSALCEIALPAQERPR